MCCFRMGRFNVQKATHWEDCMRASLFGLACVILFVGAVSDPVFGFFKLVESEIMEHQGNVKFTTKQLLQPYSELCSKIADCDDALEQIRSRQVRLLRRRLRFLGQVELILWKLQKKKEAVP